MSIFYFAVTTGFVFKDSATQQFAKDIMFWLTVAFTFWSDTHLRLSFVRCVVPVFSFPLQMMRRRLLGRGMCFAKYCSRALRVIYLLDRAMGYGLYSSDIYSSCYTYLGFSANDIIYETCLNFDTPHTDLIFFGVCHWKPIPWSHYRYIEAEWSAYVCELYHHWFSNVLSPMRHQGITWTNDFYCRWERWQIL